MASVEVYPVNPSGETVDSGAWDSSINWSFSSDGVLTISGRGGVYPYVGTPNYPWGKYADQITSLIIEEGITFIQIGIFHLPAVTHLSLPASMTQMAYAGFDFLESLKTVTVASGNSAYCVKDNVIFTKDMSTLVAYPRADIRTTYKVPDGVKKIADSAAFNGCKNLVDVTIPASVTSIGHYAFGSGASLKRIYFEGNAPELGFYLFFELEATVYYPAGDPTWTSSVMNEDYGGTITWASYTPGSGNDGELGGDDGTGGTEEPEENYEYHNTLAELTNVDYLAFAQVAYEDFNYGETVQQCFERQRGNKWDNVWGEDNITYAELCEGIAQWKVCYIRQNAHTGFYAVAFQNANGELILSYRGSEDIKLVLSSFDAMHDWLDNDLPMIVLNKVLDNNQIGDAFTAYTSVRSSCAPTDMVITGHSLGGGLGDVVAARYGCKAQTVNAISILDIIYCTYPELMGSDFAGLDAWNFTDHANGLDVVAGMNEAYTSTMGFTTKLKPYVQYASNYSDLLKSHSISSLIRRSDSGLAMTQRLDSWRGSKAVSGDLWFTDKTIDMGISEKRSIQKRLVHHEGTHLFWR